MSTIQEILTRCEMQGITVTVKPDGKLDISGPREAITKDLLELLREHKTGIISYLLPRSDDYWDYHIQEAIAELGRHGVSPIDYPGATTHRAMELEEEFTAAANSGDKSLFLNLLNEWRNCFH